MKKIKFREWIYSKQWHYWGYLKQDEFIGPINPKNKIMQYTGLKDRTGKEIYEGDIIVSIPLKDIIFEIVFGWNTDNNAWGWSMKSSNQKHVYSMDKSVSKMEVIGNIYENQELIEVKNAEKNY